MFRFFFFILCWHVFFRIFYHFSASIFLYLKTLIDCRLWSGGTLLKIMTSFWFKIWFVIVAIGKTIYRLIKCETLGQRSPTKSRCKMLNAVSLLKLINGVISSQFRISSGKALHKSTCLCKKNYYFTYVKYYTINYANIIPFVQSVVIPITFTPT